MTKIYYFSGTGNSLWSAKKIAEGIGGDCELFNIGAAGQESEIVIEADSVVLVYPSYAYGLPVIVRRFIKQAVFKTPNESSTQNEKSAPYIASFVTYGSSPRGTQGELRRILKKKGIVKMFFGNIPAVENYLALFGPPKAQTFERRNIMQEKATEEAVRQVLERRENTVNTFCPFSAFVSWLFSLGIKIFYKYYRIGENCNGCAVCQKVCPVSAIIMRGGRPHWTKKCQNCQGCINICPLRAIQFGRVKFGTAGYIHHKINISDLYT